MKRLITLIIAGLFAAGAMAQSFFVFKVNGNFTTQVSNNGGSTWQPFVNNCNLPITVANNCAQNSQYVDFKIDGVVTYTPETSNCLYGWEYRLRFIKPDGSVVGDIPVTNARFRFPDAMFPLVNYQYEQLPKGVYKVHLYVKYLLRTLCSPFYSGTDTSRATTKYNGNTICANTAFNINNGTVTCAIENAFCVNFQPDRPRVRIRVNNHNNTATAIGAWGSGQYEYNWCVLPDPVPFPTPPCEKTFTTQTVPLTNGCRNYLLQIRDKVTGCYSNSIVNRICCTFCTLDPEPDPNSPKDERLAATVMSASVSPNPNSGSFTISLKNVRPEQRAQLTKYTATITDNKGMVVQKQLLSGEQTLLRITGRKTNPMYVNITDEKGRPVQTIPVMIE
jgi:hypothetical protein